jgi:ElaB/YqjD/DUF883 family membrane-anchored ribosome-binding protein
MTNQERDRADSALWSPADAGLQPEDRTFPTAPAEGTVDVEVEVIAAEIDDTRADLGQTIDEIGRRLEPGNVAREAGQSVRDATTRKVDHMTSGIQQTVDDVRRGDASGIVDTITRNPIPTAMVAVGLGLLFMNRGAQSSRNGNGWSSGSSYGDRYTYGYGNASPQPWGGRTSSFDPGASLDRASARVSSAADEAGQSVQQLADDAGRRVQEIGDTVGQTAGQVQDQAGWMVRRGTGEARRMFDENPLAVGVVAVAAGAAIGMLVPSTDAEREALGPARDRFVDQAQQQVNQAIDSIDQGSQPVATSSTAVRSTRSGSTSTRSQSSTVGSGGTQTSRGNKSSSGRSSGSQGGSSATNQGGAPD